MPFRQAAEAIAFFWGVEVSESTVRRQTEAAGVAYVAVQAAACAQLEQGNVVCPAGPAVQQLSLDGAMVPLVGGEWTEVKTAAIGTVETRPGPAGPEVHTTALSYFSRMADVATFTREVGCELVRRGIATAGTVVAVSDGATWIPGVVDIYRRDAVRILDFPHAVEHLSAVSQVVWGVDSEQARTWVTTQAHTLKHGDPAHVLAALGALPVAAAADPRTAVAVRDLTLAYLTTRYDQIQYATFRQQGYPIGSGAVESGNKLVVEVRLKGSGMHWAPDHVNPMVALRTVACADRWPQAWPRICQELRQRWLRRPHRPRSAPHPVAPRPPLSAAAVHALVGAKPSRLTTIHHPPRQRPPMVVDGKPTADHPWHHAPPKQTALSAKN